MSSFCYCDKIISTCFPSNLLYIFFFKSNYICIKSREETCTIILASIESKVIALQLFQAGCVDNALVYYHFKCFSVILPVVWQQRPLLRLPVTTLMKFTDTLWSLVAVDLFLCVVCTTSALVHCGSVFNFYFYCKIKILQ